MDVRLGYCGALLRAFLEDDLSEAHLGLTPGARAHLERFRSFLLSFYAAKFGYYPPSRHSFRSAMFEAQINQTMAKDFESLYSLLVDQDFTAQHSSPTLAQAGGICVLQNVESFDNRHGFKTLDHPLPLLPESEPAPVSKRMSWMPTRTWSTKGRPDPRLAAHTALVNATNKANLAVLGNDLVRAYRKFEEDSVFRPLRADRLEKISLADARKVRWILVYAVHQTLRTCTAVPPEVCDVADAPYHLAISTAALPPWGDEEPVRRPVRSLLRTTQRPSTAPSLSLAAPAPAAQHAHVKRVPSYEIKPDIDYFALTHPKVPVRSSSRHFLQGPPAIPPRRQSLTRDLIQNVSVRRPLSMFRSQPSFQLSQPPAPRGHTKATLQQDDAVLPAVGIIKTNRSSSTSSSASADSTSTAADSYGARSCSSGSYSDPQSPLTDYSSPSPLDSPTFLPDDKVLAAVVAPADRMQQTPSPLLGRRRPSAAGSETDGSFYSVQEEDELLQLPSPSSPPPPAIPARSRKRESKLFSVYGGSSPEMRNAELRPPPLRIRKDGSMPLVEEEHAGDCESEWERFADLGGLRPVAVPPI